ncbi:hypothetical protein [uncultured Roseobacter sp.]|uniref:hypothetical protein n=1 Tax=uncultured Roseobacter sp. TaxID=114847 RepID=UPI00260CD620|nr:hypothetical protein [uncultured Roseobacter sp.]
MKRKTITIKNVDQDVIEMLADLRLTERRQLAAILEDCVNAYVYADGDEESDELLTSAA